MKFCVKILETLSDNGIRTSDYKYIEMFNDYERMLAAGEKVTFIVATLCEKYNTSESTAYRVLRRFKRTIKR